MPPRSAQPRLEQRIEIETPEQVAFGYTVAGIGSRGAAAILDLLLLAIVTLVLWLGFGLLVSAIPVLGAAVRSVAHGAMLGVHLRTAPDHFECDWHGRHERRGLGTQHLARIFGRCRGCVSGERDARCPEHDARERATDCRHSVGRRVATNDTKIHE